MKNQIIISSLSEIDSAAREFISLMGDRRLWAFYGSMGAGKTTFTAAICRALGVVDSVSSPTFAIVNEYRCADLSTLYHFDFYRIKNLSEAMDIGLEDYLYSGNLCIMEWPENVEELLPDDVVKVSISVNPDMSRTVDIEF